MSKKQSDRQSVPRLPTSSSVFSRKTRKTRKIKIDNERVDRSSYYIAKEPNSRKGILEKFLETLLEDKIQTRFPIVRTTECKFADSLESLIEITCIAKDFRKIQEVDLQSEIIRVDGSKFLLNNSSRQYFKSSIYTGLSLVQETNETTSEKIPDESQSVETVKTTTQSTIMAPPVVEKLEKIIFHNGNIYEGPTNEYLMHGNGKFVWSDNTIYNGEFKDGFITGKGRITLPDLSIYEGEFCNGFFHGKGFLNVASTPVFYSGDWKSDRKDGNGWILYGAGDWYEGEWKMDMRDGKGCRKYKNGAKYIGDWVENKKQGKGKMLFYNDDYYNGGWYDDMLHGYGEYTWDLIDNKTFCFPIYNWYKGAWKNGVREGIGIMNFGTECGAKYAGTWRNNIKHGPGVMICGNGLILESNPLFEYDKPIHKNSQISLTQLGVENRFSDFIIQKSSYYDILELINSQIACDELDEVILVKITVKSQYIPSNMFVKINNSISDSKKIWCPLYIPTHTTAEDVDLKYFVDLIFEDIKNTSEENFTKLFEGLIDRRRKSIVPRSRNSSLSKSVDYSPELNDPLEKIKLIKAKELKKLKNSIIIYLPKLKMMYEKYATFAKSKSILGDINLDFKPVLVRFFLWQLLRDLRVTEDVMENPPKSQHTVTFDDTNEYIYSSDSADIIQSDGEPTQSIKTNTNNLSKTSSALGIGCDGGDMQSASSISTSILDDVEEVKMLKKKITDLEIKNKLLDNEVEKVNLCLINERTKTTKLEKKLQFVKDNQDVFIKLKEAYINMKYNEAAGRKMIEIREKSIQTWEGILCRSCIDAEQWRRQLESVQKTYKDSYFITPLQLEQLLNTIKYLKELIERRESSWSGIAERYEKINEQLQRLENENRTLHDLLQSKDDKIPIEIDFEANTDMALYKKIIVKYEKKLRELEKSGNRLTKFNITFNEKEKKIIQYLMSKYFSRLNDKVQEKQRSRSTSRLYNERYGRGSSRKTESEIRYNIKSSDMYEAGEMGDTTLRFMNCIIDSTEDEIPPVTKPQI
ncbi:uncharacterized protein LOC130902735 isoform X1 [Diorhabda carinulata]|uniref:uncharacterized protein LOC130902735 isoform X1 n=1 Tax=Diorhabda carinulata TaxID=1163345 RepID=UPI0025A09C4D|nr:uncharacterized protein LOC130902735 isoform X1 [Diorhabda carinulata]